MDRATAATDVRRGIQWMASATLFMVASDSVAKHLSGSYPTWELIWSRHLFQALLIFAWLGRRAGPALRTGNPVLQLVRSALLLTTTGCFYLGLRYVPLADAVAVLNLSPVMVTALSAPLLGERVGGRRWAAVLVGFLGVIILLRPGQGSVQVAVLLPLAAALQFALFQIVTRRLSGRDDPVTTMAYTPLVGAVVGSLLLPAVWVTPTAPHWGLMAATGVFGFIAHLMIIRSFAAAPAATVAPFNYLTLVWAGLLGFILFDEIPDAWTIAGAAVIVASGVYIFHREGRQGSRAAETIDHDA